MRGEEGVKVASHGKKSFRRTAMYIIANSKFRRPINDGGKEGEEEEEGVDGTPLKFHDLLQLPSAFTTDYLREKQIPTMSENM